jgi:RNA polymerase subunit RPABC4/transcription elongation factor Spt4
MVVLLVLLTYLIPAAIVAELVYRDAQKNSTQSATMWSIIVLLFFLLGVLMYVLTGRDKLDKKSGVSCHECGANINEADEFCPSCGTEVERVECGNCGETARAGSEFCSKCGHELTKKKNIGRGDKNENGFSVSGSKWYYGVLTGGVLFTLGIAFFPVIMLIIFWLLIPLCLYLDMNYVGSNSEGVIRNTTSILVFGLIPFINILVAGGYLYMRNTKIGEPSWSSVKDDKGIVLSLVGFACFLFLIWT